MLVRVFGYSGVRQLPVVNPTQDGQAIPYVMDEGPLWRQVITTNGATPVEMTQVPGDVAKIVRVEIPNAEGVRYELNKQGPLSSDHVDASVNSPYLAGQNNFFWYPGATISFIDAGAVSP